MSYIEGDVQRFFATQANSINAEYSYTANQQSIHNIEYFTIKMQNLYRCKVCDSDNHENFDSSIIFINIARSGLGLSSNQKFHLSNLIKSSLMEEDRDKFCNNIICQMETSHYYKETKIMKQPHIIIFQIKRYKLNQMTGRIEKNRSSVIIPRILNIDNIMT